MKSHPCGALVAAALLAFPIPLVAVQEAQDATVPDSFRKVREARNRIATAYIRWHEDAKTGPFAERGRQFHESRIGGSGVSHLWLGDEHGVTARIFGTDEPSPYAGPITGYVDWQQPDFPMQLNHQYLDYIGGPILPPADMRTLGLMGAFGYVSLDASLGLDGEHRREKVELREERLADGRLKLYRSEKNAGGSDITCDVEITVDPKRDWNPTEARVFWDGALRFESRTELQQVDGIWYPRRVEYFDRDYQDGREASQVVEIDSAELNRPEQPKHLTVGDLGVEPGMAIRVVDRQSHWTGESRYWTGEKLLGKDDYTAWLKQRFAEAGIDWEPSPAGQELRTNWKARDELTPWEKYVQEFIEKYKLGSEQRQKAWLIHDECVTRAQAYVSAKHDLFDRIERAAADLQPPLTDERRREADWAIAERPKLLRPVQDIFNLQLKPRLLRLLPAAQRKAAAQAEAPSNSSQPAVP